ANTGAAWAEQHALLLERSSKALFLIDQRPSSLRACQHALDLCARCGIATGPFLYAVNRCSKNALFTSIDVSCSLRGAHVFELKDGGGEVEELLGAGLPFDLLASRNDLCASLERVLSGVLPGDRRAAAPPEEGASRGPGFRLPVGKKPRRRRKEAPCL
ncbi:MAG: chromosome partitioning protein ParA, partial [Eggerthella lenta]